MKQEDLQKLSEEDLLKKQKNVKTLIGIYIPVILALAFFIIRDYFTEDKVDSSMTVILICSIGGFTSLFPSLRMLKEELAERN